MRRKGSKVESDIRAGVRRNSKARAARSFRRATKVALRAGCFDAAPNDPREVKNLAWEF